MLEPLGKTSFRCPASMSPRPRGCNFGVGESPIRGTSPPDRSVPPPAGPRPARLLPTPIRPWLRGHPVPEAPRPPPRVAPRPPLLPRERVGRPASVAAGRWVQGGATPRSNRTVGGGLTAGQPRPQEPGPWTSPPIPSYGFPTRWPCPHRGHEPQPAPGTSPTSPPLSRAWSGESVGRSRDALSQRSRAEALLGL